MKRSIFAVFLLVIFLAFFCLGKLAFAEDCGSYVFRNAGYVYSMYKKGASVETLHKMADRYAEDNKIDPKPVHAFIDAIKDENVEAAKEAVNQWLAECEKREAEHNQQRQQKETM